MKKRSRGPELRKSETIAMMLNLAEIGLSVALLIYVIWTPRVQGQSVPVLAAGAALAVIAGAVFDMIQIGTLRSAMKQLDAMEDVIADMEQLNIRLRSQRHDFLNHLQVVYSLMEMQEYEEASRYIEKIYGQITLVSSAMRTANPAVNALIHVKSAACQKEGIRVELEIAGRWKELPLPELELCKVLSNLIDNAMDALNERPEQPEKILRVAMSEDLRGFRFSVADNGPMIPETLREAIFQPMVTTKADGHGMGLFIARDTLEKVGGRLSLQSDEQWTVFSGELPKAATELPARSEAESPETAAAR